MSRPGFTAESSLYVSDNAYRPAAGRAQDATAPTLTPQYYVHCATSGECRECCDSNGFCWSRCPWDPVLK
jgi:hypothetical protein